ncbi:uncharacterized protein VTP21DRAFT_4199 [Calcarisporiella thermophila]|uniref:uncharacterized protein n=1 Tax=Calcarisporiella thermophila TaxID=911321 RepID=UPI0037421890
MKSVIASCTTELFLDLVLGLRCLAWSVYEMSITVVKYALRLHDGRQTFGDAFVAAFLRNFFYAPRNVSRFLLNTSSACCNLLSGVDQSQWVQSVNIKPGFKGYWIQKPEEKGEEPDLVILYFHGGGYFFGYALMYLPTHVRWINKISKLTGKRVAIFCPEYSLAPENKFPTQPEEALASYRYLLKERGIPAKSIVLAGDSAGGNMALVLGTQLLKAKDDQEPGSLPLPGGSILISPWCRMTPPDLWSNRFAKYDYLDIRAAKVCRVRYLGENPAISLEDPRVSPVFAKSLRGFPPCFISCGGLEVMYDEIKDLEKRMKEDGVVFSMWEEPRIHIFAILPDLSLHHYATIDQGAEKIARFLRENVLS